MYDDQIKDIRRVTWDGMEAMSFHQLRLGVENLQQQVRGLEIEVVNLTRELDDVRNGPGDPEIESLEAEVELWFEMACDLYDVIMVMEDQMALKGIGIRPMGQQVLVRFREAMEELADIADSGPVDGGELAKMDGATYDYVAASMLLDEDEDDAD